MHIMKIYTLRRVEGLVQDILGKELFDRKYIF